MGNAPADAIAAVVEGYRKLKRDEYWLLEPGDPFYECYETFDALDEEGPKVTSFVRYFTQDGSEINADWDAVRPKRLSTRDLNHFRQTANRMLIGRGGTIIVSAGTWGRRPKPNGGYEYLPFDEYDHWLAEQLVNADRTSANRPAWAERVVPWTNHDSVDYVIERGDIKYTQKLRADGLEEPRGNVSVYFKTADDLRAHARAALAFADLIDGEEWCAERESAPLREEVTA